MASVSYGRYNVFALLDAYRLSADGHLVLHESRLDALTHFFVARDSMYRQVYQHRVLQGVDALSERIVLRLRDLLRAEKSQSPSVNPPLSPATAVAVLERHGVYCDSTMALVLLADDYAGQVPLHHVFEMTEAWWGYHVQRWIGAKDSILADLSARLLNRRLFKTIRLEGTVGVSTEHSTPSDRELMSRAETAARDFGFDPRYYVFTIQKADKHRGKEEEVPPVLLDNGEIVPVTSVEPLIAKLLERPAFVRTWLAVPKEVKEKLGRYR